jgi:16S rRNA processing protein RimM
MAGGFIEVGRVAAAHGVAGNIKVTVFSGDPAGLLGCRAVCLRGKSGERHEFEVETVRRAGRCAVFSLKGISAAEEAKNWVGSSVLVLREELPPPQAGEYYIADLVGCVAVTPSGELVGEVGDVMSGPAHDWLVILRDRPSQPSAGRAKESKRKDKEAFLPFVAAFVKEVDTAARRIVVSPPEGWSDAD